MEDIINVRHAFSIRQLEILKEKISRCPDIVSSDKFCIFTTGSYGRLEAGEHSDLDLFFAYEGKGSAFSKISKTLIDASIIKICREMDLPEFSGDGEYLEVHDINRLYDEMGSRNDDYYNLFTARMLLLLESRPLYNSSFYEEMLKTTVRKYYKDFNSHETNFQPAFLVNDVIRFWRTMCLNYEHSRNRRMNGEGTDLKHKKNESHLKNLKLKFSRKLTCYSFLLSILWTEDVLNEGKVLDIIRKTPLERLNELADNHTLIAGDIAELLECYRWFLEVTQKSKQEVFEWISDDENRNFSFNKAREFARAIFELMMKTKEQDRLMYFLV